MIIGDQRGMRLNAKSSQFKSKQHQRALNIRGDYQDLHKKTKFSSNSRLSFWIAQACIGIIIFVDLNSHHLLPYLLICLFEYLSEAFICLHVSVAVSNRSCQRVLTYLCLFHRYLSCYLYSHQGEGGTDIFTE